MALARIEILEGRRREEKRAMVETKRHLYGAIISGLASCEVPANDILVVLHEPPKKLGGQRRYSGERGRSRVRG
jgi:hypothetical protein